MGKIIQIRDVSDEMHKKLKSRAVEERMTLSDYLKKELGMFAERPTFREWAEMVKSGPSWDRKTNAARLIREMRDWW